MVQLLKKMRLFPLRHRIGGICRGYSMLVLVHLAIRWLSCPFEKILEHIPLKGVVYDLGCGHGLTLQMLDASLPEGVTFVGFDFDEKRIGFARAMNVSKRVRYELKDISRDIKLNGGSCVILNDVLLYLAFEDQDILLRQCFDCLSEGGVLVIKDITRLPAWKYYWTDLQGFVVNRVLGLTKGEGFFCRPQSDFVGVLQKIGFKVDIFSVDRGYLYSHILYKCVK